MTSKITVGQIYPISITWQSAGEDHGVQDLCLTVGRFLSKIEIPFGFLLLPYVFKT
jgi:hypothetical protein